MTIVAFAAKSGPMSQQIIGDVPAVSHGCSRFVVALFTFPLDFSDPIVATWESLSNGIRSYFSY